MIREGIRWDKIVSEVKKNDATGSQKGKMISKTSDATGSQKGKMISKNSDATRSQKSKISEVKTIMQTEIRRTK